LDYPHIRLVRLTSADTESLQQYAADPVLSLAMSVPRPFPADGATNFVRAARTAWRARRWLAFSIKHRNEFVGLLTIGCPDPDIAISYWVARPFWNRGYATAAVRQSLNRATRFFGAIRVLAVCLENNLASQRVLEKNEFKMLHRITISNVRFRDEAAIVYVFEPPAVTGS
jgi:[ribosomal protein S5]-alanine N-acetyltransferase